MTPMAMAIHQVVVVTPSASTPARTGAQQELAMPENAPSENTEALPGGPMRGAQGTGNDQPPRSERPPSASSSTPPRRNNSRWNCGTIWASPAMLQVTGSRTAARPAAKMKVIRTSCHRPCWMPAAR